MIRQHLSHKIVIQLMTMNVASYFFIFYFFILDDDYFEEDSLELSFSSLPCSLSSSTAQCNGYASGGNISSLRSPCTTRKTWREEYLILHFQHPWRRFIDQSSPPYLFSASLCLTSVRNNDWSYLVMFSASSASGFLHFLSHNTITAAAWSIWIKLKKQRHKI